MLVVLVPVIWFSRNCSSSNASTSSNIWFVVNILVGVVVVVLLVVLVVIILAMHRMADNLFTQFTKEEQGFAYLAYWNDMKVADK